MIAATPSERETGFVTTMSWLSRLVWWFPSRLVAAASVGLGLGGILAVTTTAGLFPPTRNPSPPDMLVISVSFVIGLLAGSISIWMVRGRWPGGESLSRVEREAVIHSAHFGQDVGSNDLAEETRSITAYERSRLECSRERWPFFGILAVQMCFSVFSFASSGRWVAAVAVSLVAGSALWCARWVVQSRPQRREQLWNAEWYAAQRLDGAAI